jgi:cytochrome oxidase assembly protein ShyY1
MKDEFIIKNMATKLLAAFLASLFFIALGFWQLGRAKDEYRVLHQKSSSKTMPLSTLSQPGSSFTSKDLNATVSVTGQYVNGFIAPNQAGNPADNVTNELSDFSNVNDPKTYDVRWLAVNHSNSLVLVVRGAIPNAGNLAEIKVPENLVGRYYPAESNDRISPLNLKANQISRIDPVVFVGATKYSFYPGYLIIGKETPANFLGVTRLPLSQIRPQVAGYYWQHLLYVAIWWLFAILVWFAPFYEQIQGRLTKNARAKAVE